MRKLDLAREREGELGQRRIRNLDLAPCQLTQNTEDAQRLLNRDRIRCVILVVNWQNPPRLERSALGELVEANTRPEIALDSLLLGWPRPVPA